MKKYVLPIVIAVVVVLIGGYRYVTSSSKKAPSNVYVANEGVITWDNNTGMNASGMNMTGMDTTGATESYNAVQNSVLNWKATKPTGFHTGTIDITDGYIAVKDNMIQAGQFAFDMLSIKMMDSKNDKLEGEIKNDFFDANKYPVSRFKLDSVTKKGDTTFMNGDLTIKDQTHPISFPVTITMEGDKIKAKADFAIDRNTRGLDGRKGMVNDYLEFSFDLTWQKAL